MIYEIPATDNPIDQCDIIEGCFILSIGQFDLDGEALPRVDIARSRVLVLTQACDLVNAKAKTITVASVFDAQHLVDEGLLKPADIRGPIRGGRVFGWYFLPSNPEAGLPEMIVDLRQLHTARRDLLDALCRQGMRRARLRSPYREHLAKHFADTYSRIGLPLPYESG